MVPSSPCPTSTRSLSLLRRHRRSCGSTSRTSPAGSGARKRSDSCAAAPGSPGPAVGPRPTADLGLTRSVLRAASVRHGSIESMPDLHPLAEPVAQTPALVRVDRPHAAGWQWDEEAQRLVRGGTGFARVVGGPGT